MSKSPIPTSIFLYDGTNDREKRGKEKKEKKKERGGRSWVPTRSFFAGIVGRALTGKEGMVLGGKLVARTN